ncbi:hypothetical protein [Acinetobacter sp. ACNIH1]|uniref:hypothetical protein n=1 Tax=Acinetobacter sp. ACNIH1 TaxID=1636603 RepID=UPI000CDBC627|nr:hypothetical protein [Acinetobacter sp. ACNIH1]AUX90696.1 hypothetical protein C3F22_13285 [Acinetobacter sp. ACNIH1]
MKKLFIVFFILSLAWIAKLSYDLFGLNSAQTELTQNFKQLQQQNANLNDQLVALKRQVATSQAANPETPNKGTVQYTPVADLQDDLPLVEQYLDLVEFALQQQQYAMAMEKLNQLSNQLEHLELAPTLLGSLNQAIDKDREVLKQFINNRLVQQNKLKELLQQIDVEMEKEIQVQHQNRATSQSSFWQRWIQIESVEKPSAVLMQRNLVLKEAQLRLLIAENSVQQGQQVAFQQALKSVIEVLAQLPDAQSKQWIQRLEQIKAAPQTPTPQLNTRTLIG